MNNRNKIIKIDTTDNQKLNFFRPAPGSGSKHSLEPPMGAGKCCGCSCWACISGLYRLTFYPKMLY